MCHLWCLKTNTKNVIIVSFFFLLFLWCVFSSFFCQTPLKECTCLSSVSVSGAPGSHTTYITHKVGVLCSLLLSCLGSSYVVLFSIFIYLFLSSSICFISLYRHSLIGQSTSRLPPSRPAHTTLRFLFRYLFRSLYHFFIFYFLFVSFFLRF